MRSLGETGEKYDERGQAGRYETVGLVGNDG